MNRRFAQRSCLLAILALLGARSLATARNAPVGPPAPAQGGQRYAQILRYISNAWTTLSRSVDECKTLYDPKSPGKSVLYFPAGFRIPAKVEKLPHSCPVRIKFLPPNHKLGDPDVRNIHPEGLLYLPHPYVVPGGMFNEMYGWDSYFIVRGLLEDGRLDLARGMVGNFIFEIKHYGGILNANRTYYLTRSQPPFFTEMVRAVYDAEKSRGRNDRAWLARAYPFAVESYRFWTQPPHLAGSTGLSRYFGFGSGPAPELAGADSHYYRDVASYFLLHPNVARGFLILKPPPDSPGPLFPLFVCNPSPARFPGACKVVGKMSLSTAFYKNDRSLRESGFDVTFRFGPFGDKTTEYAPVDLNSLIYREAKDLAWMSNQLGRPAEARVWRKRAARRREAITKCFWNARRGLYFDYDFKTGNQSGYVYASTFFPLWAGVASQAQARAVIRNVKIFDEPGGIVTSRTRSGGQWDFPYGWAPLQLIAVEGLRRYGDRADARRIAAQFLSVVNANFLRDHTIREKYNVVTRSSETHVSVGYVKNQVGFGWTNGVFVTLLRESP